MNKKNQQFGRLAAAMLLAVVTACGSSQATSSALAGTPVERSGDGAHLTEFDQDVSRAAAIDAALQQAIALDQQNEQQRLAQQGASATQPSVSSPGGVSAGGPALVP